MKPSDMIHFVNPCSRKDKPGTTFTDRIGIALLALLTMLLVVTVPVYLYSWYKNADSRQRKRFIAGIVIYLLSAEHINLCLAWLMFSEAHNGFGWWLIQMAVALFLLYRTGIFLRGYYRWLHAIIAKL